MRRNVLIFLNEPLDDETVVNLLIESCFPKKRCDVSIITLGLNNGNPNDILGMEQQPIIVGYRTSAAYLEGARNYGKKYLISPTINSKTEDSMFSDIDTYDRENTYGIFGSGEWDVSNADRFMVHYPKTVVFPLYRNLSLEDGLSILSVLLKKGMD